MTPQRRRVLAAADDPHVARGCDPARPIERRREQAPAVDQLEQRLGMPPARPRPEPLAGAAGEHHRVHPLAEAALARGQRPTHVYWKPAALIADGS